MSPFSSCSSTKHPIWWKLLQGHRQHTQGVQRHPIQLDHLPHNSQELIRPARGTVTAKAKASGHWRRTLRSPGELFKPALPCECSVQVSVGLGTERKESKHKSNNAIFSFSFFVFFLGFSFLICFCFFLFFFFQKMAEHG